MIITAGQVKANPDEAANYIALTLVENERMRSAISAAAALLDGMAADCMSTTRSAFREGAEEIAKSLRAAIEAR